MKVKDFLEWFSDFDPESELEFDLFEEKIIGWGGLCRMSYTFRCNRCELFR